MLGPDVVGINRWMVRGPEDRVEPRRLGEETDGCVWNDWRTRPRISCLFGTVPGLRWVHPSFHVMAQGVSPGSFAGSEPLSYEAI